MSVPEAVVTNFDHVPDRIHAWLNQYNAVLYVNIAQKQADNQFVISIPGSRILHLRFGFDFLAENPESTEPVVVANQNYGKLQVQLNRDGDTYLLRVVDSETKQFLKTITIGDRAGFVQMIKMMEFSHKLMEKHQAPKKKREFSLEANPTGPEEKDMKVIGAPSLAAQLNNKFKKRKTK